jgi:DNA-binding transcriptional MocR family regulator
MNAPHDLPAGTLTRAADQTLAEQLALRYAERIAQRLLPPGARLPSVREGARRHAVSPSTVVAAYDQLLARGLVESRPQRGFFVREGAVPARGAALPPAAAAHASPPPKPVDATALIRGMFAQHARDAAPGLGTLPPAWLDLPLLHAALRRAMADEKRSGHGSLQYGDPAGDPRLRDSVARRLAGFGIAATPQQIVTTVGATHALDVVARTLLRAGDAVLVDEPGWAVEYARLTRMGLRLLPVPRGSDGPDLQVMRALMQQHHPRLYVTVSVLHNPTGAHLSAAAAHQVLQLADAHDVAIVEDDTYAHLASPHLPRLAALDGLRRTIYVGGFSKILTPGWRVGFVAAPARWLDALVDTKLLSALTSPALLERAMAHCIDSGALRRHAERVSTRLQAARVRTQRLAEDAGCHFAMPPQGLFGWVDTGVDTERLSQALLDAGWLIAPGRLFHVDARPTTLMRINFATTQDAKFWRAFAAAKSALR